MPIKNYTTQIDEHKTVAEIQAILASKGARSIQIQYDDKGRPDAVQFLLIVGVNPIPFKLPCNFDGVFRALAKGYKDRMARARFERDAAKKEQARKVAWRIVKDWIDAQMALVEAEQAQMGQVFLPYAVTNSDGVTMFERFLNTQLALPESTQV